MAFLFRCESLTKSFGHRRLFAGISISFDDGQRTGLIGPNGSGKSTLLKILADLEHPDDGTITMRRNLRLGYVPQADVFATDETVRQVMTEALDDAHLDPHDRDAQIATLLTKIGFTDLDQVVDTLSGGWRKRLAIARQLIRKPDVLLLDEPTNHLDLEGILWLEKLLANAPFAFLLISHDRYFLESATNRTVELNAAYADGYLSINSNYSDFLEKKEAYLAAQASLEQSIAGRVRREIEWLKRGAKARTTKAKGRIEEGQRLMGQLADLRTRNAHDAAAGLDFVGTNRQTRKLLVAERVSKSLGDRALFKDVNLTLGPGTKLGLLGPNGSGKSTLIKLLTGQLEPDTGTIKCADGLRIVLFDQTRAALDPNQTLRRALSDGSETVVFRGEAMHVSSWARRFLFSTQQLDMAVRDLSGGEQSRILIARLMLQPADVLILDEPTNDLDIPSLEVLEESLADFPGALVLVTHDRYMIDQLATEVLGLDGLGGARTFADLSQYERARDEAQRKTAEKPAKSAASQSSKEKPKKLTYMEQREFEAMDERIMTAEADLDAKQAALGDPAVMADHVKMADAGRAVAAAQAAVDALYRRWEELEAKRGGGGGGG
jgi:ABC transport system ATP-binding/permease protein